MKAGRVWLVLCFIVVCCRAVTSTLSVTSSAPDAPAAALSVSEVDAEKSFFLGAQDEELMRGEWVANLDAASPPAGKANSPLFLLSHERGLFYLQVELTREPDPARVVFLAGDLLLRDGVWSSDFGIVYGLQGAEFAAEKRLLLYAYPRSSRHLGNFSLTEMYHDAADNLTASALLPFLAEMADSAAGPDECAIVFDLSPQPTAAEEGEKVVRRWRGAAVSVACAWGADVAELALHSLAPVADKANNYALFAVLVYMALIRLLIFHLGRAQSSAALSRVSPVSFFMLAVLDAYYCMGHLAVALVLDGSFLFLSLATFLIFLLFSVFEMGHVVMILKARSPDHFANPVDARRRISVIYARFYASLLTGFVLLYLLQSLAWVLLLAAHAFWLPQIAENVTRDSRRAVQPLFVWGTSALRLLVVAYFMLCPQNFLSMEPSPKMFTLLAVFVGAQAWVLAAQERRGSRFFVPEMLLKTLPAHYNYYRSFEPDPERAAPYECVICMESCNPAEPEYSAINMVTPCQHVFHEGCLRQWLEQQLKCPTCRRPLPAPHD